MRQIDFYVQHLVRHKADAVELSSGGPVTFKFPQGDRQANKAVEHAKLAQLVQEAAPPEALAELRSAGTVSFGVSTPEMNVEVTVRASSPGAWRLRIQPARVAPSSSGGGLPPAGARPSPAQVEAIPFEPEPAAAPAPAPAAAAPVESADGPERVGADIRVQTVAGEPKINELLRLMKELDASDLHLCSTVVPMARVHGEMVRIGNRGPLSPEELKELLWEIMPEKNRDEYTETSDTDFAHPIEGLCRFRANVFEDRHGIGGVFRQIPFELLSHEVLGIPKRVLDLCYLTKGLVLVTGPTGSGKSTTLATLIDYINMNRTDHIITIEDPVEFVHQNKKCLVNQREVGTHTDSFKKALRAALREDPDIVLVGEMRDLETIAIAVETAETGHLVFGTLHTTSAPSTVDRIIDQFPADQQSQIRVMLSESLKGVISQVLCKKIGGGRVAGYEVLVANAAVANLIREGKTFQLKSVMQTGRKLGMQTMNDHILDHVKAKLVDPQEAYMKSNDKLVMKQALAQMGHKLQMVED